MAGGEHPAGLPRRRGASEGSAVRASPSTGAPRYATGVPRQYLPSPKHKWPKGFGTLCPALPEADPQQLLQLAIQVPGVGNNKLWVASGRWCFCAQPSGGEDVWHGFPVIGGDVDERVWTALEAAQLVTAVEVRRLRRQRALPEAWP